MHTPPSIRPHGKISKQKLIISKEILKALKLSCIPFWRQRLIASFSAPTVILETASAWCNRISASLTQAKDTTTKSQTGPPLLTDTHALHYIANIQPISTLKPASRSTLSLITGVWSITLLQSGRKHGTQQWCFAHIAWQRAECVNLPVQGEMVLALVDCCSFSNS